MLIKEMKRNDCIALLTRAKLGRLACAHEGQPYITPMSWVYEHNYLYAFSTPGQKIRWLRENPLACVEFEEIVGQDDWATVIVLGRYEELWETPEYADIRDKAYQLLRKRPGWWNPGYAKTELEGGERPMEPLFFRIEINQISGHQALRNATGG